MLGNIRTGIHHARIVYFEPRSADGVLTEVKERGLPGLADAPHPGRPPTYDARFREELIATTLTAPADTTHWSTRRLAKEVGASPTTVRRIWDSASLRARSCWFTSMIDQPAGTPQPRAAKAIRRRGHLPRPRFDRVAHRRGPRGAARRVAGHAPLYVPRVPCEHGEQRRHARGAGHRRLIADEQRRYRGSE